MCMKYEANVASFEFSLAQRFNKTLKISLIHSFIRLILSLFLHSIPHDDVEVVIREIS